MLTLAESSLPDLELLSALELSPEERLVLACARVQLTEAHRNRVEELLEAGLRWDMVLTKAQWHSLTPLVFHHLSRGETGQRVPGEVMAQLKAAYLANAARNMYLRSELVKVLDALKERQLPVILLKGAALLETVYGEAALRPMTDLDLMVPPEQAHCAQAAVMGLGYRQVGTPEDQDETEKHHRHLPGLVREGMPVLVEVHRHIVRQDSFLYFDINGFWSRAQEVNVANRSALTLSPEDQVVHLAVNFFLDRRFRSAAALRQLCDVAESIRFYRSSLDWGLLAETVTQYRLAGPVGCSLYLARELLDAPVPDEAAQAIWPDGFAAHEVSRFVRRRVLDTQGWVASSLVSPGKDYSWGSVAMSALKRLAPSRSYLAYRYKLPATGPKARLLYALRLMESARVFWRMVTRPGEMSEDLAIDRWHHSLYRYRR